MKIKKIKLLKALALTSSLGIVATVPIIVSSCSTTSSDNGSNNGGSDNNGSGGGSNPGGSGGGTGGNSSTSKVTPKLQSKISLVGSLSNIYDGKTDTNDLLATDIKNNPEKVFTNYDELKGKNFTITVDGEFSKDSTWSGDNYSKDSYGKSSWGSTTIDADKTIYYNSKSSQIDISSLNDLKTKLSNDFLKNAFKEAGVTIEDNTTLSVSNKLGLTDGDLLHVNIVANTSAKAITNYDLQIPVSDINLDIQKCNITISGNDVETVNQEVEINYNIGIQDKMTYTGPTDVQQLDTTATETSVMTKLGFVKISKVVQKNSFNISREGESTDATAINLDSDKIGQTFGIYNTTFSNPKLTLEESTPSTQAGETNTNYLTYKMTVDGTPNSGYYFEDGTNTSKSFSFDVKINQKTATFDTSNDKWTIPSDQTITWASAGVDPETQTSNDSELETKLEEFANGSNTDKNIQSMLDQMTNIFVKQGGLTNAHVTLLKDGTYGYLKYGVFNGQGDNVWQIRVTAKPDNG